MGVVLIAWSIHTKQQTQGSIAARKLDNFVAAAGITPSRRRPSEPLYVLQERKERAEWLLIAGFVLCGLGVATAVAAKK